MKTITPKEVLNSITDHLKITIAELALNCGYERPQAFYDVLSNKTKKISSNMAKSIISAYPIFELEWILSGQGKMLKDNILLLEENTINYKEKYIIALEEICELKSTIIELQNKLLDQKKKEDANMGAEVADAV
jgi:hypothetical protein